MKEKNQPIYEFDKFRLDPNQCLLWRGDEVVSLTPKVFETLLLLVESNGKVLTKEQLIDSLWADSFVEEGSLTQNISLLRKRLDEGKEKSYIETLPKRGYRFTAEVRKVSDEEFDLVVQGHVRTRIIASVEEDLSDQEMIQRIVNHREVEKKIPADPEIFTETLLLPPAIAESKSHVQTETKYPPNAKFNHKTLAIISVIFLLLVGASVYFVVKRWQRQPTTIAEVKSIAVLPFQNINAESGDQYLGMGLADALITKFGNLRRIEVRPTTAIRKYAETKTDPIQAGRELGVEAVIDGSIRREGNRIRVTIQLLKVSDGSPLWSEKFDAEFTNMFSVEDSISEQVARRLISKLTKEEETRLTKRSTSNSDAYQRYLQGQYFYNQLTSKSIHKAIELFEEAIRLDSSYSLAHTGLARCYLLLGDSEYGELPPTEAYTKARTASLRALELDPLLADAHLALAKVQCYYDWDFNSADKSFNRALELNPRSSDSFHAYGWFLIARRQFSEADKAIGQAVELDPTSLIIMNDRGYPSFYAGDYDTAIKHFNKPLEFDANFPRAHFALWRAYHQKGMYEKALAELDLLEKINGETALATIVRAITLAAWGKTNQSKEILTRLTERAKKGEYIAPIYLAVLNSELNDMDSAIMWLQKALVERNDLLYLKVAPEFKHLLPDPRTSELLQRAGLSS